METWALIGLVVLAIVVIALAVLGIMLYRGFNKIKPKPLEGIPIPPLTHPLLGHPDKLVSPYKHELRLGVCEAARGPFHQLVMMKNASVFINDGQEAARLLDEMPSKGPIYAAFRLDPKIPDILASDADQYILRKDALGPALQKIELSKEAMDVILKNLSAVLKTHSESGKPVDLDEVFGYLAFDCVCHSVFGYQLDALSGAEQGGKLYRALITLQEYMAGQGLYANPNARKIPAAELQQVQADWKDFLVKLVSVIRSDAETFKSQHGELLVASNVGHALVHLADTSEGAYGDNEMKADVHQLLRHGYECIAGQLGWLFFALHRHPKTRARLEAELDAHSKGDAGSGSAYPEYLEGVIKETLRRYPVAGNMTVRTVNKEDFLLTGGYAVPVGTPIHFHMWSLHNTTREWTKPKEFHPERWLDSDEFPADAEEGRKSYPSCPFLAAAAKAQGLEGGLGGLPSRPRVDAVYEGAGHEPGSLSFFPFSAGERSCPAKGLVLQVLREVVKEIVLTYRLDPSERSVEEDCGASTNAVITPLLKASTNLLVTAATGLGEVPKKKEDGWADDEEEAQEEGAVEDVTDAKTVDEDDDESQYEKVNHSDSEPN